MDIFLQKRMDSLQDAFYSRPGANLSKPQANFLFFGWTNPLSEPVVG